MRTEDEILKRLTAKSPHDFLGTASNDLLPYLSYAKAKPFLKPEVTEEEWNTAKQTLTDEAIIEEMRNYMEFALGKADGHRGISSGRSIEHYQDWLWLLGDNELLAFALDDANYPNYGVPILKAICDKYGFPFPEDEDMQRMAKGLKCREDCDSGCG